MMNFLAIVSPDLQSVLLLQMRWTYLVRTVMAMMEMRKMIGIGRERREISQVRLLNFGFGGNHVLKVDLLVVQRVKRYVENGLDLRAADHDRLTKEKAAFVDCKCEWGLFRDRNVTLRKPVRMNHGIKDLKDKGLVVEYDRYICMTR